MSAVANTAPHSTSHVVGGFAANIMHHLTQSQLNANSTPPLNGQITGTAGPLMVRPVPNIPNMNFDGIVVDLPPLSAGQNVFGFDQWSRSQHGHHSDSVTNLIRFGHMTRRLTNEEMTADNRSALAGVWEQYQIESRIHSKINTLRRDKMMIMEQMKECDATEQESVSILQRLVSEHSALEQRLRPRMKRLLHNMHCIETRILRISDRGQQMTVNEAFMKKQFERQYNFYAVHFTECENALRWTSEIRSKYQNTIRTVMEHRKKLGVKLEEKEREIESAMDDIIKTPDDLHVNDVPLSAQPLQRAITDTPHNDASNGMFSG